jgi:hypothetical protein
MSRLLTSRHDKYCLGSTVNFAQTVFHTNVRYQTQEIKHDDIQTYNYVHKVQHIVAFALYKTTQREGNDMLITFQANSWVWTRETHKLKTSITDLYESSVSKL